MFFFAVFVIFMIFVVFMIFMVFMVFVVFVAFVIFMIFMIFREIPSGFSYIFVPVIFTRFHGQSTLFHGQMHTFSRATALNCGAGKLAIGGQPYRHTKLILLL